MAVNCPFCQYPNFAGAKKCRRCGKALPKTCPECGHPLPDEATFCAKCGAIFQKEKVDPEQYKTKSSRSHSIDDDRKHLAEQEGIAVAGKPKVHRLKKCPECWHNISEEAAFCTYCGTRFDQPLPPDTPPTPSVSVRQPGEKKEPAKEAASAKTTAAKPAAKKPPPKDKAVAVKPKPAPEKPPAPPTPIAAGKAFDPDMLFITAGSYPHPAGGPAILETRGFRLARAPVTCAQYKRFCDETGLLPPPDWYNGAPLPGKDQHPVVMVSFADALAYCRWAGRRLPTGTEWAIACGGKSPHKYPWGDDARAAEVATVESGATTTRPVRSQTGDVGPFAQVDLVGNARQWVFDPNPEAMPPLPGELPSGKCGLAGASYVDPIWLAANGRVDFIADPQFRSYVVGFRCAADV